MSETATRQLLNHRKLLYAYILAIVRDRTLAEDVFQEVAVVIIRRWDDFGEVRDFWALARGIARRQCLGALRKSRRSPVLLSEEVLDAIDRGFDQVAPEHDAREAALQACVAKLPPRWSKIVRYKYWDKLAVSDIACKLASTENSVSVTLHRIRARLATCIREALQAEEACDVPDADVQEPREIAS